MKNAVLSLLVILFTLSCNSQKVYSDFDISYSKSGGTVPTYENLLIKGNSAHYSFEGPENKTKQNFKITAEEVDHLNKTLSDNQFRNILEDRKKLYDKVATSISVKTGANTGSKTDASLIMPKYKANWENITNAFQEIINKNIKNTK
ncbi:MAG: hypothetical protein KBS61_01595 [Chryseobacterium sp.]|nr:hypothetical protein [Candidatus Chryseobacterium enterohippi]